MHADCTLAQDLEAAVILLSFRGVRLASRHESAQQRAARLLQQQAAGDPTGNIKSTAAAYAELGGALRAALQVLVKLPWLHACLAVL
jgi:hypothetical protein